MGNSKLPALEQINRLIFMKTTLYSLEYCVIFLEIFQFYKYLYMYFLEVVCITL